LSDFAFEILHKNLKNLWSKFKQMKNKILQSERFFSRNAKLCFGFMKCSVLIVCALFAVNGAEMVLAQVLPLPSAGSYNLPSPSAGAPEVVSGFRMLYVSVSGVARIIIGIGSVLLIVITAVRMIAAQGDEAEITKQKGSIAFAIAGFALIGVSNEVEKIFTLQGGGLLRDPKTILERSGLFNDQVKLVITFIKYFIGSVAVFQIIRSAFALIIGGSNDESWTNAKNSLIWSSVALVVIVLSNNVINDVFFRINRNALPGAAGSEAKFSVGQFISELVGFTNYILLIVSPVLVLMFVAGGVLYVTSGGEGENADKAKNIIFGALIGSVIVYGAFALVSTFISGSI
jgi:hypothetical protein